MSKTIRPRLTRRYVQRHLNRRWLGAAAVASAVMSAVLMTAARRRASGDRNANPGANPSAWVSGPASELQRVDSPETAAPHLEPRDEPSGDPGSPLSGGKDTDYPAGVWIARVERIRRILPPFVYLWITGRLHARWSDEYAWRNRDDIENDRGIPPPDERIGWHGVWIAESILPSTISALGSGGEKLGWWEPYRDRTISGDVAIGRSGRGGRMDEPAAREAPNQPGNDRSLEPRSRLAGRRRIHLWPCPLRDALADGPSRRLQV
jgi:hypothetical protein